jgi:hypothetical protein
MGLRPTIVMETDARHWGAGLSPRGDLSPLAAFQAAALQFQ